MFRSTVLVLTLLFTTLVYSQSYPGLNVDNFAGVHGLLLNPANAAATRTGFELNLLSVSVAGNSDYGRFAGTQVRDAISEEDYGSVIDRRSLSDANRLFAEADVLGPSILIGLGKRSGLAVITRLRSSYATQQLSGGLFEGVYDSFESLPDFAFSGRDHRSTLHSWGEVMVTFGTTLIDRERFVLKFGASYKALRGLGAVYTYGEQLEGAYSRQEERVSVTGDLTYGRTPDFYLNGIDGETFSNPAGGSGFDAGLVLLWRPDQARDARSLNRPYRLKLAASLVDLGRITYDNATETAYTLTGTVAAEDIEDAEGVVEDVLDDNFPGTTSRTDVQVSLPTALHLLVDFRMVGPLYASATFSSPIPATKPVAGTQIPTAVTISPRLETKSLSLHLPVTFREGQGAAVGAGVRFGMLTIGSGSLISHVLGGGAQGVDVFTALKLPFPRRQRTPKGSIAPVEAGQ
jgi:hypothetical protein